MIKKDYIAPTIEVVEMEVISMCTSSNWEYDPNNPPEGELSNRRRDFWGEIGKR